MTTRPEIVNQFTQVAEEQGSNLEPLTDNLPLLETGLDSLCFVIVVGRLAGKAGADGSIQFFRGCSVSGNLW